MVYIALSCYRQDAASRGPRKLPRGAGAGWGERAAGCGLHPKAPPSRSQYGSAPAAPRAPVNACCAHDTVISPPLNPWA